MHGRPVAGRTGSCWRGGSDYGYDRTHFIRAALIDIGEFFKIAEALVERCPAPIVEGGAGGRDSCFDVGHGDQRDDREGFLVRRVYYFEIMGTRRGDPLAVDLELTCVSHDLFLALWHLFGAGRKSTCQIPDVAMPGQGKNLRHGFVFHRVRCLAA